MSDAVQFHEDDTVSCFQCPSTEWIIVKGVPAFCKYCKHPYPKYVFKTNEEKELYAYGLKSIQQFNWTLAKTQLTKYVKAYPGSPYGYLGLLQVKLKFTFQKNESTQEFEVNRQDITPVQDITHDPLYKQGVSLLEQYNSLNEIESWKKIALYLKKSIQDYERLKNTLKPCEVFISFKSSDPTNPKLKTEDDARAKEIYDYLTTQGGFKPDEVFYFSENHRAETGVFEAKIFYRLETAKVLVLLGSKLEYVSAQWVQNEWSRFYLMIEDRLKHPDALILALENTDRSFIQKLPEELKSRHYLEVKKPDFLKNLTQAIHSVINTNFTPKVDFPMIQFDQATEDEVQVFLPNQGITSSVVISDINQLESQIAQLQAAWKSPLKTEAKIKSLIEAVLEINPSQSIALKYDLLLAYHLQDLHEISSWKWLKSKEDGIPLLKYLGSLSYEERFNLLTELIDSLSPFMQNHDQRVSMFFGFFLPNMSLNFLKADQQSAINTQIQKLLLSAQKVNLFFSYASYLTDIKEEQTYVFFTEFLKSIIQKQSKLTIQARPGVLQKCIDYYQKLASSNKVFQTHTILFKRVFFKFLENYLTSEQIAVKPITELLSLLHFFNDLSMNYEVFFVVIQTLLKKSEFKLAGTFIDAYIQTYRQHLGHFYVFRFMAQHQLSDILDIFKSQDLNLIKIFTEKLTQEVFGVKDDHLHQATSLMVDLLHQQTAWIELSQQEKWIESKPIKNYFKTESIGLSNTSNQLKEYQSLPAWKYEPPLFATPYTASILYLEGPYLITGKFIKSLIKNVPHIKKLVVGPKTVVDLNGYDQSVQKELEDASSNKVREFSLILMPRSIVLSETLDQALSIYKIEMFNEKTLPKFSQFVSNNFNSKNLEFSHYLHEKSLIGMMQTPSMNFEASTIIMAYLGLKNDMILRIKHQPWLTLDQDGSYFAFIDELNPIKGGLPKLTSTLFPSLPFLLERLDYAREQHHPNARLNYAILSLLSQTHPINWKEVLIPLIDNMTRNHYPSLMLLKYFHQHYPESFESLDSELKATALACLEEIPKSIGNNSKQQNLDALSDAKFEELKAKMMTSDQEQVTSAFKQLDFYSSQGDLRVNLFLAQIFYKNNGILQKNYSKVQKYASKACLLGSLESCHLAFKVINVRAKDLEILSSDREKYIEPIINICKKGAELNDSFFIKSYEKIRQSGNYKD